MLSILGSHPFWHLVPPLTGKGRWCCDSVRAVFRQNVVYFPIKKWPSVHWQGLLRPSKRTPHYGGTIPAYHVLGVLHLAFHTRGWCVGGGYGLFLFSPITMWASIHISALPTGASVDPAATWASTRRGAEYGGLANLLVVDCMGQGTNGPTVKYLLMFHDFWTAMAQRMQTYANHFFYTRTSGLHRQETDASY